VDEYFNRIDHELERSKETFIQHFKSKYDEQERPPAWMMFEALSFGQISLMCLNLNDYAVRNAIALHFGFPGTRRQIFESWLQSIVYVRNICAHHSRLWNRILTVKPSRLMKTQYPWINGKEVSNSKLYYFLCAVKFLLGRVNPENSFGDRLRSLIDEYAHLPIGDMGFPDGWQNDSVWEFS
jgi:abortive infection bacteriophage resistance protein